MSSENVSFWVSHPPAVLAPPPIPMGFRAKATAFCVHALVHSKQALSGAHLFMLEAIEKVSALWTMVRPAFEITKVIVFSPLGKILCLLSATMVLMKAAEYGTSHRFLSMTCLVLGIACAVFAGFAIYNFNASFSPL